MSKTPTTNTDMAVRAVRPCLPRLALQPYVPVLHVGALVRPFFPVFQTLLKWFLYEVSGHSDRRKQAITETQEVSSEHKETFLL